MDKKEEKKFEKASNAWAEVIAKQAVSGEWTKEMVKDAIMALAEDHRLPLIDQNNELARQVFELTAELEDLKNGRMYGTSHI